MKGRISLPKTDMEYGDYPFQLVCFPLGKADAFLLTTPKSAVLIDAGSGESGELLADCLRELGVSKLDFLIISHFHADHVGGVARLLKEVCVEQVLECPVFKSYDVTRQYRSALKKWNVPAEQVDTEQVFYLDGAEYSILPPKKKGYARNRQNNSSLFVRVRYGAVSFLFMGDAREERIQEYLETGPGHCDVLKVPHHGHWQRPLLPLLRALTPRFTILTSSSGRKEDEKTVTLLKGRGCRVCLTRKGGAIFHTNGKLLYINQ